MKIKTLVLAAASALPGTCGLAQSPGTAVGSCWRQLRLRRRRCEFDDDRKFNERQHDR